MALQRSHCDSLLVQVLICMSIAAPTQVQQRSLIKDFTWFTVSELSSKFAVFLSPQTENIQVLKNSV